MMLGKEREMKRLTRSLLRWMLFWGGREGGKEEDAECAWEESKLGYGLPFHFIIIIQRWILFVLLPAIEQWTSDIHKYYYTVRRE